jgi:hypothetical protein
MLNVLIIRRIGNCERHHGREMSGRASGWSCHGGTSARCAAFVIALVLAMLAASAAAQTPAASDG